MSDGYRCKACGQILAGDLPPLFERLSWCRLTVEELALLQAMVRFCSDGSIIWASLDRLALYSKLEVRRIQEMLHGKKSRKRSIRRSVRGEMETWQEKARPGLIERRVLIMLAPATKTRPATYRINEAALDIDERVMQHVQESAQLTLPGIKRTAIPGEIVIPARQEPSQLWGANAAPHQGVGCGRRTPISHNAAPEKELRNDGGCLTGNTDQLRVNHKTPSLPLSLPSVGAEAAIGRAFESGGSANQGAPSSAIITVDSDYVKRARIIFRARPCIQAAFSAADAKFALTLQDRGISLEDLENAILLGCARKYISGLNEGSKLHGQPRGSKVPIVSLRYFANVIDEITAQKPGEEFWKSLRRRLPQLERDWLGTQNPQVAEVIRK